MKKNLSTTDSVIRVSIAILVVALYFANVISGTAAIVLLIISGIFLITGFISFCPIYFMFGWSTRKKEQNAS